MEEYDEEPAPRDRAATFFGFVLTACSGLSVLALGFGAAQVASSVLFPPEDLPQVEADVPVLRDAIGPSLGRAAASGRSPLESQAVSPALPGRPEAEPEPETLDGRPAQTAPRRVEAGFLETASRGGAPSTALSASPPPSFAGLADPVAPAPRIAGRAQPRPSRASEAPLSREPGEAPKREPAWRPRAAPGPTPPGVAHDQGRQQIERILASAGVPIGGRGAGPGLSPFPAAGGNPVLMFQPALVASYGGRVGQGAVSMEGKNGATLKSFDARAKGLGATPPAPPRGTKLPAGNAPALPADHIPYIVQASQAAGIDPALLAAVTARESSFGERAYRAEPQLNPVSWREAPGKPAESYFDGSIGPTQVLRSNFKAFGIDNDREAYALSNNYRISARIIRSNVDAFPGDLWKGVAAYNVGQYGARQGRVPAGGYTDAILAWRAEYRKVLAEHAGL